MVAYFLLRAEDLLEATGQTGLIATNTLAQGDSREVGLDQVVSEGAVIRSAIKSEPWPSRGAVLEFCAVWTSKAQLTDVGERFLNRESVKDGISSSLDLLSRTNSGAKRLAENEDQVFQGSIVLGLGFTMTPSQALALIDRTRYNDEVLFPYLSGQDLNQRPDGTASRWVINFFDRNENAAKRYHECYEIVERLVKPERQRRKPDGTFQLRKPLPDRWWQFADKRPKLYGRISDLAKVIVLARVSKTALPLLVDTGQVFNDKIVVFTSSDTGLFAFLSSASHYWWSIRYSSTRTGDLNYSPTDVFLTLARPRLSEALRGLGARLDSERRESMLSRQAGLTDTYNMVHDRSNSDPDILNLREIHRLIDIEVCRCYGWDDLIPDLAHDHYETRQGDRYTIAPGPRQEILDRLLEENQRRYALEVGQGLHSKGKAAKKAAKPEKRKPKESPGQVAIEFPEN